MLSLKIRKRIIAPAFLSLLALAGCGGDDPFNLGEQSVAGTWRLRSATVDGRTINCPGSFGGDEEDSCGEGTVRFGLDKSFVMDGEFYGGVLVRQTGTWDVNGNALSISITDAGEDTDKDGVVEDEEMRRLPETLTFDVGLEGDRLTLRGRGEDQGTDLTFEKEGD